MDPKLQLCGSRQVLIPAQALKLPDGSRGGRPWWGGPAEFGGTCHDGGDRQSLGVPAMMGGTGGVWGDRPLLAGPVSPTGTSHTRPQHCGHRLVATLQVLHEVLREAAQLAPGCASHLLHLHEILARLRSSRAAIISQTTVFSTWVQVGLSLPFYLVSCYSDLGKLPFDRAR